MSGCSVCRRLPSDAVELNDWGCRLHISPYMRGKIRYKARLRVLTLTSNKALGPLARPI